MRSTSAIDALAHPMRDGRPCAQAHRSRPQGRDRRANEGGEEGGAKKAAVEALGQDSRQEGPSARPPEAGKKAVKKAVKKARRRPPQAPPLAALCACNTRTIRQKCARLRSPEGAWRTQRQASARSTTRPPSPTGHHQLTADEGPELGGKDAGPAPYDLLTSALGACTVITLRMYAERKQWPVTAVHADIHFKRAGQGREHRPHAAASRARRRRAEEAHGRHRRAHAGDADAEAQHRNPHQPRHSEGR